MILKKMLLALLVIMAPAAASAQLPVLACEPEWAALARELGGDAVTVRSATTPWQDPHRVEARPSLIVRLRRARLLVCTGAGLEAGWLPQLLRQAANPRVQPGQAGFIEAALLVPRLEIPATLDRSRGDLHPDGNPHVQLDPRNVRRVADVLAQRLQALVPAAAADIGRRHAAFVQRWDAALQRWEAQARPLAGRRVVSHHRGWSYLLAWLHMEDAGSLEPRPGVPPSAAHLHQLLQQLQSQPAHVIIRTAYQSPRAARWLSERTGIPAVQLPHTVGATPGARDLEGLFDDILQRLLAATGSEQP